MPHPVGLPDIFLDRSLGRLGVSERLSQAGLRVITLADHYGIKESEEVADEDWLKLVAQREWIAFTKEKRIRTREAWAVDRYRVRVFCLFPSDKSKVADMADRFLDNLTDITAACSRPGPFFYHVQRNKILWQRIMP